MPNALAAAVDFERAENALKAGRLTQASAFYGKVLERFPDAPEPARKRALIALHQLPPGPVPAVLPSAPKPEVKHVEGDPVKRYQELKKQSEKGGGR